MIFNIVFDSSHKVQADFVDYAHICQAFLVDSTGGNVSSSSGKSKAEGPAANINFLSTLICTFFEFVLASTSLLALCVLIRASLFNALYQGIRLSSQQDDQCQENNKNFHVIQQLLCNQLTLWIQILEKSIVFKFINRRFFINKICIKFNRNHKIILQFQRLFQSQMISQIRFKEKVNKSANIAKNIKRLPLFSMELDKFKKQQINPQSRHIDNLKINTRSSIQDQKIKINNHIDNNTSQSRGHSSQTNIFIPAQLHQNNQNIFKQQTQQQNDHIFQFLHKKQVYPHSTSTKANEICETKMLDENVINKSCFLTLENITNREKTFDKSENQKDFTSLNFIFAEDTKHQKQNKERQRNKNIFIDMKKKIRKISKVQKNPYCQKEWQIKSFKSHKNQYIEDKKAQLIEIHNQMLKKVYQDTEVIIDGCIFRNKIVPQRIDNDVDTDDEQINSGIRRLHKSLSQVALQYTSIMEKDIICSFDPERNEQEQWEQSSK